MPDVDYSPFSSSAFFLPPLTQHPSFSISIMSTAFHRFSLLYPLPSPLLLRLPLLLPLFSASHSLLCFSFFITQLQTLTPSFPLASPPFFFSSKNSLVNLTLERDGQQVRNEKTCAQIVKPLGANLRFVILGCLNTI